jgi:hypothetical protein
MSFRIEERLKIAPENALTKGGKAAEQQVRRIDLPRAHARRREWHLAGGSAGDEVGGRPLGRARRATRATRTGGAALASLARAGAGQAPRTFARWRASPLKSPSERLSMLHRLSLIAFRQCDRQRPANNCSGLRTNFRPPLRDDLLRRLYY